MKVIKQSLKIFVVKVILPLLKSGFTDVDNIMATPLELRARVESWAKQILKETASVHFGWLISWPPRSPLSTVYIFNSLFFVLIGPTDFNV